MSRECPEVKIVAAKAVNGKREILQVDPKTGIVARTGLHVHDHPDRIHEQVQQLAEQHKRAGNRVSYREV